MAAWTSLGPDLASMILALLVDRCPHSTSVAETSITQTSIRGTRIPQDRYYF